ncbi:bifunctional 2-polyprenyl-6-hydroxyphenol methylase/3-demethylubiquinol 3-O-methyltransferase UbiG [Synechococcus sp. EJ6-Ellesmere]|uniref:class I SAM-dependent methyltransferase n=1 Tax=Synechococcus sp. EJ6-Ellesmere TaxID=2823734 RepID=UPI0020CF7040|nr:class I SAM-dependent methyltransferase [Synechococcus sp. EJ6-Ellesmere]MCP9824877.1 class I SAM-dependent methyltransferase [Synechococcus sp. EJ6-Ellesmere]
MISEETNQILSLAKEVLEKKVTEPFKGSFGKDLSERRIETPWVASFFKGGETVLDVGFTMSSHDYLGLLLELIQKYDVGIEAIDIIEPQNVLKRYPVEWVDEILKVPVTLGDLRNVSILNERYDFATCISTIEHIGFDSPASTGNKESAFERALKPEDVQTMRDPDTNNKVLNQFHRALKPGGVLLISVPMGRGGPVLLKDSLGYYCAQWEYEEKSWSEIANHPGFELLEEMFFIRTPEKLWCQVTCPGDLISQSSSLRPHAEGCALAALRKKLA